MFNVSDLAERPRLKQELEYAENYILLPLSTTRSKAMEYNWLFWVQYKNGLQKIILSTPSRGKDKDGQPNPDKITTWRFTAEITQSNNSVIVIDKSKLGRKKRIVTEKEKKEILQRRAENQNIHTIAKAMQMGTRLVSAVIKDNQNLLQL